MSDLNRHIDDLNEQADAAEDPALEAVLRIRARHAEDLARHFRPPLEERLYQPGNYWHAPAEAQHEHLVRFHWDDRGLLGIEIIRSDGDPLRVSDIRDASKIPFRELIRKDRAFNAETVEVFSELAASKSGYNPKMEALRETELAEARARAERSKSPHSAKHWERIARIYSEAVERHDPAPVRRVAETAHVSRSTARNWVAKCRALGFLPPTEERKAKGNL